MEGQHDSGIIAALPELRFSFWAGALLSSLDGLKGARFYLFANACHIPFEHFVQLLIPVEACLQ